MVFHSISWWRHGHIVLPRTHATLKSPGQLGLNLPGNWYICMYVRIKHLFLFYVESLENYFTFYILGEQWQWHSLEFNVFYQYQKVLLWKWMSSSEDFLMVLQTSSAEKRNKTNIDFNPNSSSRFYIKNKKRLEPL